MKSLVALMALAAVAFLARPAPAGAHAAFITANPAPDSVVTEYPEQIRLVFAEQISRLHSWVVVTAPDGTVVSGDVTVENNVMTAPLWWGGWGVYQVEWYNISLDDGHEATAIYWFTVPEPPAE